MKKTNLGIILSLYSIFIWVSYDYLESYCFKTTPCRVTFQEAVCSNPCTGYDWIFQIYLSNFGILKMLQINEKEARDVPFLGTCKNCTTTTHDFSILCLQNKIVFPFVWGGSRFFVPYQFLMEPYLPYFNIHRRLLQVVLGRAK